MQADRQAKHSMISGVWLISFNTSLHDFMRGFDGMKIIDDKKYLSKNKGEKYKNKK